MLEASVRSSSSLPDWGGPFESQPSPIEPARRSAQVASSPTWLTSERPRAVRCFYRFPGAAQRTNTVSAWRARPASAHLSCEIMLRKELVGRARRKSYPLAITQTNLSEMTDLSPVHVKSALRALRGRDLITFG